MSFFKNNNIQQSQVENYFRCFASGTNLTIFQNLLQIQMHGMIGLKERPISHKFKYLLPLTNTAIG